METLEECNITDLDRARVVQLNDVTYNGWIEKQSGILESLSHFDYAFAYGRSYLLNSELEEGSWAVSWLVGGLLEPSWSGGTITKCGRPFTKKERLQESWFVRQSEFRDRHHKQSRRQRNRTVQSHIQQALKNNPNPYLKTEAEIIKQFLLTPERYRRKIMYLSHEGWRASCAIGLAQGKRIFCFPYLRPYLIREYFLLWFKHMVDLLRNSGAIVLIPTAANRYSEALCDEVVHVRRYLPEDGFRKLY